MKRRAARATPEAARPPDQAHSLPSGTITRPADPTRSFTVTLFDEARRAIAGMMLEPRLTKYGIGMPAGRYTFEVHDEQFRLVQSGTLEFTANPCSLEIR